MYLLPRVKQIRASREATHRSINVLCCYRLEINAAVQVFEKSDSSTGFDSVFPAQLSGNYYLAFGIDGGFEISHV
jgi:hypothetical protein